MHTITTCAYERTTSSNLYTMFLFSMGSSPTAWILFCFVLLSGIDKYLAGDNVVSAYPRRDKKNTEVPRRTGGEWCLTSAFNKSVHSIILGSDWGAVPTSDRKTWKSRQPGLIP